jgi:hypothetical protein
MERNALGLPRKSELKLGDKLGPEVPEGTSCPDEKADKEVRNNENFMAVEFGIALRKLRRAIMMSSPSTDLVWSRAEPTLVDSFQLTIKCIPE